MYAMEDNDNIQSLFSRLVDGGDDAYLDFRSFLIYQGQDIVNKALNNPDEIKSIKNIDNAEDYLGIWTWAFDEY